MNDVWQQFARRRPAAIALLILIAYLMAAIFGPILAPYDPLQISAVGISAPSATHWLGTDQLGRDVFSRLLYGARSSLLVACVSVGFALIVGTSLGLLAGYFGAWVDTAISRLTDVMFALPDVLLALVIMAVLGQGLSSVALAIGIVYTPIFARVCRGAVLRVRKLIYVEAAQALGVRDRAILYRHILPNILPPLIVQTTLSFAFAILAEATLSFLGLSGEADAPLWGLMLRQGKDVMHLGWWLAIFPGLAITSIVLCFNLLGDGLQAWLDPRQARN